MRPQLRAVALTCSGCALLLACSVMIGCGSESNGDEPRPDGEALDAVAESSTPDVGRDTAKADTKGEHVPRAPRCVPGDAGVDAPSDVGVDATSDTFEAGSDTDVDADLDASADGGADADAAPIVYRAVQVANSGGRVLRAPRIVPITFDSDPNRLDVEDFVASVGCTPYWHAISAEYGIGDAVAGAPIHLAETPPDTISDSGIEKWLRTNIQAATPGWEAPTPDTIYAVYYPATTRVRLGSSNSCESFDGFHKSFTLTDGTPVVYAVMMDCGEDVDRVTGTTSHELIEASTDPEPLVDPTHLSVDAAHAVYGLFAGGEVGDLCTLDPRANFTPAGYPFVVQRSWSNAASLAMRDPCVPAQSGTYFNTWPELPDVIGTNFSDPTAGVKIKVGESRTIMLDLYSDGPTDPWSVSVRNASGFGGGPTYLTFALDKTTGVHGDRIALTITKKSENDSVGAEPFMIVSTNAAGRRTTSYGMVGH